MSDSNNQLLDELKINNDDLKRTLHIIKNYDSKKYISQEGLSKANMMSISNYFEKLTYRVQAEISSLSNKQVKFNLLSVSQDSFQTFSSDCCNPSFCALVQNDTKDKNSILENYIFSLSPSTYQRIFENKSPDSISQVSSITSIQLNIFKNYFIEYFKKYFIQIVDKEYHIEDIASSPSLLKFIEDIYKPGIYLTFEVQVLDDMNNDVSNALNTGLLNIFFPQKVYTSNLYKQINSFSLDISNTNTHKVILGGVDFDSSNFKVGDVYMLDTNTHEDLGIYYRNCTPRTPFAKCKVVVIPDENGIIEHYGIQITEDLRKNDDDDD